MGDERYITAAKRNREHFQGARDGVNVFIFYVLFLFLLIVFHWFGEE